MQSRPELHFELFKHIPPWSADTGHTWCPSALTCDPSKSSWSYTCSIVSKCSKVLTIGKFNAKMEKYFDENILRDFVETNSFPALKPHNNSSVQFSVKLYPHGENDDCTEYLSLYLKLKCNEMMKVAVKVKVSVMVKENWEKAYTFEIGKMLSNGESIGWPKFITREQLNENEAFLLNGKDQLVLLCEVFYIENIVTPVTKSGVNTFADKYRFSFARDLSQLYTNQKLTDIVFEIGDKKLNAHKSIVSARSSMFARMFKRKSRVQIKGVDVETFSNMLALVYGQTEALTHMEPAMLPLLDKYELSSSLKKVCQIVLCSQLSDTNIAQCLLLADKHKATMLKDKAFDYICRKHSVLTQNDSLKVIQQQNPKLFHELLCYKLDNWKDVVANPLQQLSSEGLNPNAASFTPSTMTMSGASSSWQIQPYYITAQVPSPWTVSGQSDNWEVTQQVFVQPRHPIYIAYNLA